MKSASLLIAALACAAAAAPARAAEPATGELIVKLAPSERAEVRERADVDGAGRIPGLRGVDVVVPADGDAQRALEALRDDPAVVWAEPVRPRTAFIGDALLPELWGLDNDGQDIWGIQGTPGADIDVDTAWPVTQGAGVTVAVVDTGAAGDHPDLAPQLTGGPGELGGGRESNHVDDDGNGLVDDWQGWDFVEDDNAPEDEHGHGTHVAGTAAGANGAGDIVGVAPEARVLPLRVLDAVGSGTTSDVAAAFAYAGKAGVKVVNASLGSTYYSQAERAAIHAYPNTLYVVAAGNDYTDAAGTYPCSYGEPNILCVGASDSQDRKADFSNYSPTVVDLFAPGVDILSSFPASLPSQWTTVFGDVGYEMMSGTSMASPHAAGAAALLAAAHPEWTAGEIRQALMATVDVRPALSGKAVTGGRLDAAAALTWTPPVATPTPTPPPISTPVPVVPPVATPVPTPAPVTKPAPVAGPVISSLRVVGRPRACQVLCRSSASKAALSFDAKPGGRIRLVAERRTASGYKRVGSRTVQVSAGRQRIALSGNVAGARLRAGLWRVSLGAARVTFRVR